MSHFDEVADLVAIVGAATAGNRKLTAAELSELRRDVLSSALAAGADHRKASTLAVRLATATGEFADACVTANLAAQRLRSALAEVEDRARELVRKATREN
jgi:hypothetical protein